MKELDFSRISTEELKYAVKQSSGVGCAQIKCKNCPFNVNAICNNGSYEGRNKAFKAELNRREKDMNKMPELKAGMIVRLLDTSDNDDFGLFLYVNESMSISIEDVHWQDIKNDIVVIEVYTLNNPCKLRNMASNLTLIWSKKSDKDIKIEELEKTVKEALKQIEELKA